MNFSSKEVDTGTGMQFKNCFWIVQSILFIGGGAGVGAGNKIPGAGKKIPGAGRKRTGSATLDAAETLLRGAGLRSRPL